MLISWKWLQDYVKPGVSADTLAERLMMAGLNHESTTPAGDDLVIDLEVTSNRPDCLGHIGIAREASVVFQSPLTLPQAEPAIGAKKVSELASLEVMADDLCPRYTARVIEGVKIGPSPKWLVERLAALGQPTINNVVDITNYVMLESGQPLHAFDLAKLRGKKIVVRRAADGEKFLAINHETYTLSAGMCVIADAERPVALAGVMGGEETEISTSTTSVLIESAEFLPMSVRDTARRLRLHSDSSYRFERTIDPAGTDWASRRACQLILETAGGTLAAGSLDIGKQAPAREPIILRLSQIRRILGIEIPEVEIRRIMKALGCEEKQSDAHQITVVPPSWRRDLTREIDLVEEAARIYGYDKIPEDVGVAMVASSRSDEDRVLVRVRQALTAAGFDEAMTPSAVEAEIASSFSPWTTAEPLISSTPVLRKADRMRCSVAPSLLRARRQNEALANPWIELFEVARVYLAEGTGLPREEKMLAIVSGRGFADVKGAIETLLSTLGIHGTLEAVATKQAIFAKGRAAELRVAGKLLGYLGELGAKGRETFELRSETTLAELRLETLLELAKLVPQDKALSQYPAIRRDLNIVVDEAVRWADVEQAVRAASGELLESVEYVDTYRNAERLGADKKSLLLNLVLRSQSATLTRQQADDACKNVVAVVQQQLGGELRA